MAIHHLLFHFVLLFFSCNYLNKPCVCGEWEAANNHHAIQVKSLRLASTSARGPKPGSGEIQLTRRYGPCSPLNQENSSLSSHQDQSRFRSNARKMSTMNPMDGFGEGTKLPISGDSIGNGNLVVTVGFGTPKRDFRLIFDTGSNPTWMQCQPCSVSCYPQQDQPIYDPSSSSSESPASCSNPSCAYSMTYYDKSYSNGHYIRDTLTLTPSDVLPSFIFGCGQDNSRGFGQAAGVLGMGKGALSLTSQTAASFAKIFCYCLPASESSTGYLLLGMQALETCYYEKTTPLLSDSNWPSLYFVNLVGMTFGQQNLGITSLKTVIDSGTVITRLPQSVYSALKSAFQKVMSKYPAAGASPPLLDTCYNLEGYPDVEIPPMVLKFQNSIQLTLEKSAIIREEGDSKKVCLAFAGNSDVSDLTIIGNHQQRQLNILHNIQDGQVGFGKGSC